MVIPTLVLAKSYTDSQRLAYESETILFDSDRFGGDEKLSVFYVEGVALEIGETYTLTLDSGIYTVVVKDNGEGVPWFGNMAIPGYGEDSGESYFCLYSDNLLMLQVTDGSTHAKLSTATIHPIDPKFLPGAVLPVVELSTTFAIGASYTAEENALLKQAHEGSTPVIIKCDILHDGSTFEGSCAVWQRIFQTPETPAFIASMLGSTFAIISSDNGETWTCMSQGNG